MRKVNGTGDKVNMNANSMLIGKEVDGNKITALYTLSRNGVRRRITKSEFINSARNNRIINCKFNGRSLVGIEESLRNIPAYDKKTGMLKNNITEEQVIMSVNQKLIQNRLIITAKLKYNNQIIGYIVANEQGQEKRFNRNNTYKLVRQGFLPDYKAKVDNGVPYVYGGNINSLPEIKVDSQGRNIEDKERMKKILEEQKKLREQHEKELKKQKELEKEQHRKEVISAEKIAKDLKKQLKEEDKEEKIKQDEQQKKREERNKKLAKIDRILSELGNTSEILRRQIVDVYVDKDNIEITKEYIENTCEKLIKASNKYAYALEVLKIISKANGAITQEDSDKIASELKKVATNLLDTTDNEQIIEIISNKVANKVSNVELHLVVKEIHGIWEDGTIIDLKTVGAIVKIKEKNIYIKYAELPEDLKNEANRVGIDRVVISNKVDYTNNQIENYIKIVTEQSANDSEPLNKEVIKKVKEYITDRKSDYVSLKSLNGFIDKLMEEVNKVAGGELETIKEILALTIIHPDEIKAAKNDIYPDNEHYLSFEDRYSPNLKFNVRILTGFLEQVNELEGMKIIQLGSCTVLNINGKLGLLPRYLSLKELSAGILINYQLVEQKACNIRIDYGKNFVYFDTEWLRYGNMTQQLRNSIKSAKSVNDIVLILKNANVSTGIINDIKEIKKLLKSAATNINLKHIGKEPMVPIKLYTKFDKDNLRLNIMYVEVKIGDKELAIEYEKATPDILAWVKHTLYDNRGTNIYGKDIEIDRFSIQNDLTDFLLAFSKVGNAVAIVGSETAHKNLRTFIINGGKSKYGDSNYINLNKVLNYCEELAPEARKEAEKMEQRIREQERLEQERLKKEKLEQERLEQEKLKNASKAYNKRAKEMARFYLTKELLELTVVDMQGLEYLTNEMKSYSFYHPEWSDKFITSLGNFHYRVVEDSHRETGSYFYDELKFHRFEHTIGIQVCKHNMYIVPEDISIRDFGAILLCAYEKETESSGYLEMRYEGRLSGHVSDNRYLMEETDKLRQNIYRCESMEELEDYLKGADVDLDILKDIDSIHNVMSEYLDYYFDIDKYNLNSYVYDEHGKIIENPEYEMSSEETAVQTAVSPEAIAEALAMFADLFEPTEYETLTKTKASEDDIKAGLDMYDDI